jgi:hypothetical protein
MAATDETDVTPEDDPLGTAPAADRVWFSEGQLLDARDFREEQTYHRGRLARALLLLHGSGTIAGLAAGYVPAAAAAPPAPARDEELRVEPGAAVDRFGRLVEVTRAACIRLQKWFDTQGAAELASAVQGAAGDTAVVADLFIRYVARSHGKTPAFATGPFEALNAVAAARVRDCCELRLFLRPEADPPLPQNSWPVAPPNRQALVTAALAAPPPGPDADGRLPPLREHLPGQDTSFVFLARVRIPASPPAAVGGRPARRNAPVTVTNDARPFLLPGERWVGALKPA